MVSGVARECMRTSPAPLSAATSASPGSKRSPLMSLIISAPRATAAAATSRLVVSIEIGMRRRPRNCSITGRTARHLRLGAHRERPRPRRLATDVEQISPLGLDLQGARDRPPDVGVLPAVGERVRRHVEHAHDLDARLQVERRANQSHERIRDVKFENLKAQTWEPRRASSCIAAEAAPEADLPVAGAAEIGEQSPAPRRPRRSGCRGAVTS